MNEKSSLLSKINSKYILKAILSLAYGDMKSVLKLTKYNKCLLNKLDINFQDYFKYEIEIKTDINKDDIKACTFCLIFVFFWFIIYLIYIILFYKRGTFNEKNLKEGYNKKKKDFVDFMDNYILLAYFLFNCATILIIISFINCKCLVIKGYIKLLIFIFIHLIDITHHISYIIKFAYAKAIIKKELINTIGKYGKCKTEEEINEYNKISKLIWFYRFDIFIITIICMALVVKILMMIAAVIYIFRDRFFFFEFGEIKKNILKKFKGLNIIEKELPEEFNNLNEKGKNKFLFKKENMKEFKYEQNESQINVIQKINDIRNENHIPLLKYYKIIYLPEFIINEKTQLIFNDNENPFKLSENFYVFKYPINEFQNYLNNKQILNIITNKKLKEIKIFEQNNIEFIFIYGDVNRRNKYNNKKPKIHLDTTNNINIINTEDKLNEGAERVSVTEMNDDEGN